MVISSPPENRFFTHEVINQAPPLVDIDLFGTNTVLVEAIEREGAGWVRERAHEVGRTYGGAPLRWGAEANEHPPVLRTHDRYGHRIDEVEFHPAWHQLLALGLASELHSLPWTSTQPRPHTARTALYMSAMQAEAGVCCPITMTFAAIPALRADPQLAAEWEPLLTATGYDPALRPASEKGCAISGMAMTEKQGGSDVRANTTVARPVNGGGAGGEYLLTGHKWFCSAPMSDVFLVLAQAPQGLSCFLMPRVLPDGSHNAMRLQRLKDKLGNRSNASSEIELQDAWARMLGEPGRGVPTIIEMVGHTRLDCVIGSAAGIRMATVQAVHHASHRAAFGHTLVDQPLMANVLADLALESEAATLLAVRLARGYDEAAEGSAQATLFTRLATAVGKYWVCKRAPHHAYEALECLGGNGFVEESGMPRLYREAPLASIWEGSGNVISLDVLRALSRSPESLAVFLDEVELAAGADARLDAHVQALRADFADREAVETRARRIVERMALALQGSLVVRHSPPAVADAFCASRLAGDRGLEYGTLPAGVDFAAIIARHRAGV
ncbi:MAG TPA: acyl-CoA dehydrogenase family protein [Solirubrobacteraceae bacterium]|jgi:putative acyl-CoA dehydrogenase|nr:acyl-CoA dehydrogenase family protein [Solirubrobacteraceae bacterium]